jgi:hypothetical protein
LDICIIFLGEILFLSTKVFFIVLQLLFQLINFRIEIGAIDCGTPIASAYNCIFNYMMNFAILNVIMCCVCDMNWMRARGKLATINHI